MRIKKRIKYLPLELIGRLRGLSLAKKFAKNFLPDDFHIRVLCYHEIPDDKADLFDKQIAFLKKEYNIIDAEQLRDFFLGRGFLPGTNIFITFDDGSVDQHTNAARILDKYKIRGCFFVNTGEVGEEGYLSARPGTQLKSMNWRQISELHKRGHTIGSHGADHYNLARLQPFEVYQQLINSKKILEGKLRDKIDFFAFPYGTRKQISHEAFLLAKKVYDFNFTAVGGKNHFALANRYLIKRTGASPNYSLNHLRAILCGAKDFLYKKEFEEFEELEELLK